MRVNHAVLIFAVVSAGCQGEADNPGPAETPTTTAVSDYRAVTDHYELIAPNQTDFDSAARDLDAAAAQFEQHFGAAPPPILVLIFENPEQMQRYGVANMQMQDVPVVPWYTEQYMRELAIKAGSDPGEAGEQRILMHEAGHMFFNYYVTQLSENKFGEVRSVREDKYGHGIIRDWLDEAAALICEYEGLKEQRRSFLAQNIGKRIPLDKFFTVDHEYKEELARNPKASAGPEVRMSDPEGRDRGLLFYGQALSLAEFFVDREGPDFMTQVTKGHYRGETMSEILGRAKNLPADLRQLEREWVAWVKAGG